MVAVAVLPVRRNVCAQTGCRLISFGYGYCRAHYEKHRWAGDLPLRITRGDMMPAPPDAGCPIDEPELIYRRALREGKITTLKLRVLTFVDPAFKGRLEYAGIEVKP